MKTIAEQMKEVKGKLAYRGALDSIPDNGILGDVIVLKDKSGDRVMVCIGNDNWIKVEDKECLQRLSV